MIKALLKEIKNRSNDWKNSTFNTIYFGGGTPSVLSSEEIGTITNEIRKYYRIEKDIEVTLEANPDDLSLDYLKQIKSQTDINRLSIGTQSFHNKDLKLMNRRHTGKEAVDSILHARQEGFNINIDLIYGTPGLTNEQWKYNLLKFIELKVPHLSAYHLTFEPKTVFDHMRKKNKIKPVNEALSLEQYKMLTEILKTHGYQHYEISNFALDVSRSQHNTNYWLGKPYLGIGPSAHSFTGTTRRWNIANNTKYCEALLSDTNSYFTEEGLSAITQFNEYILTSLRTQWGVNLNYIKNNFGKKYADHCSRIVKKFDIDKHYIKTKEGYSLTEQGWFISDYIISELFFEEGFKD